VYRLLKKSDSYLKEACEKTGRTILEKKRLE